MNPLGGANLGRDAPAPHRGRQAARTLPHRRGRRLPAPAAALSPARGGRGARRRRQRRGAFDGDEAEAILRLVAPSETLWLLERTGTELSSEELAARIERLPVEGTSQLTIVIAGTYGAAPALLARAQFRWSLSQLTLLHEWARVLVLEQLYRAAKIAANEPYHH